MTFSEALGKLIAANAVILGGNIRTQLKEHPDRFNGVFTPTPGAGPLHFQTTLPNDRVWYLRRNHRDKASILFGDTK